MWLISLPALIAAATLILRGKYGSHAHLFWFVIISAVLAYIPIRIVLFRRRFRHEQIVSRGNEPDDRVRFMAAVFPVVSWIASAVGVTVSFL